MLLAVDMSSEASARPLRSGFVAGSWVDELLHKGCPVQPYARALLNFFGPPTNTCMDMHRNGNAASIPTRVAEPGPGTRGLLPNAQGAGRQEAQATALFGISGSARLQVLQGCPNRQAAP